MLEAAEHFAELRRQDPLEGLEGAPLIGATWPELMQRAMLARKVGRVVFETL